MGHSEFEVIVGECAVVVGDLAVAALVWTPVFGFGTRLESIPTFIGSSLGLPETPIDVLDVKASSFSILFSSSVSYAEKIK